MADDFTTNDLTGADSTIFQRREQFLILSKRDNFNEMLDYYKTWVTTYEEVTKQKALFNACGYIHFFQRLTHHTY